MNASQPAFHRHPRSIPEVTEALMQARRRGVPVAIAGGRHAMGGQQFRARGCVLDLRGLNRILDFDREQGLITVEAGATWPEVMRGTYRHARRDQILRCYPEMPEFLERKRHWDSTGAFGSDWSRHLEHLLGDPS